MIKFSKYIVCAVAGVLVWLFWWLLHPEVLAYQEQYQMWQGTWSYFAEHLCAVGGMSAYVGEFLTQMNIYPCLGAGIIALMMIAGGLACCGVIDRLVPPGRLGKPGRLALGCLVALLMILLLCWMMGDENLLPSFLVSVVLALWGINIVLRVERRAWQAVVAVVAAFLLFWMCLGSHYRIPHEFLQAPGFNDEKSEVLAYDMLVRNQEWDRIIEKAEKKSPGHPLGIQALNLALARKQWLGDRMFVFTQTGIEGIMSPWRNNCVDNVISSEVAWHAGLINTAFRYSFDSQEAIPDKRKSARFMKRLAECCIVNGDYKAARKYLNKLKHTLFYRIWAERAEGFLFHEEKIAQHPVWGEKRAVRFKRDILFTYPEIDKILAMLAIESGGRNWMAWQYFNAAALLKGDVQAFAGMSHYSSEMFHQNVLPRHHQEAWAMLWTMSHPGFSGIPVGISADIQQRTMSFAQALSRQRGSLDGLGQEFGDTYWMYFFRKQQAASAKGTDGATSASAQFN